jgi:hypothetical protein
VHPELHLTVVHLGHVQVGLAPERAFDLDELACSVGKQDDPVRGVGRFRATWVILNLQSSTSTSSKTRKSLVSTACCSSVV